jgi:hypothetical protein
MADTLNTSEVLINKFTQSGGRFPGLYKYDIVNYKNNYITEYSKDVEINYNKVEYVS